MSTQIRIKVLKLSPCCFHLHIVIGTAEQGTRHTILSVLQAGQALEASAIQRGEGLTGDGGHVGDSNTKMMEVFLKRTMEVVYELMLTAGDNNDGFVDKQLLFKLDD